MTRTASAGHAVAQVALPQLQGWVHKLFTAGPVHGQSSASSASGATASGSDMMGRQPTHWPGSCMLCSWAGLRVLHLRQRPSHPVEGDAQRDQRGHGRHVGQGAGQQVPSLCSRPGSVRAALAGSRAVLGRQAGARSSAAERCGSGHGLPCRPSSQGHTGVLAGLGFVFQISMSVLSALEASQSMEAAVVMQLTRSAAPHHARGGLLTRSRVVRCRNRANREAGIVPDSWLS